MIHFDQLNLETHKTHLIDLNIEYLTWLVSEVRSHYAIDVELLVGPIEKYIHETELNVDEIDGLIGRDFSIFVNS